MVEIKEISLTYHKGKKALDRVSFSLSPGTFTSLLGPSGCGKTTMLKILAGFLKPQQGSIFMDGKDISNLPVQKRGMAMVFQNYALWPHMTVLDNIAYGLRLQKTPKAEIEERVKRILEIVELSPDTVADRHPAELSGGQQQRIALARALVVEPNILLMDEPLSNLDAKVRQHLRVQIREIQQRLGVTAVYVTHDQEEAMSMSDQVVLMSRGTVVQAGTPENVYSHPRSAFAAEFLGNSNVLAARAAGGRLYIGEQQLTDWSGADAAFVKLIVRTEQIFLAPHPDTAALHCRFLGTMYSGGYYRHMMQADGQTLFVDTPAPIEKREEWELYIPVSSIFTYPA